MFNLKIYNIVRIYCILMINLLSLYSVIFSFLYSAVPVGEEITTDQGIYFIQTLAQTLF